jgi:hypothetical protein
MSDSPLYLYSFNYISGEDSEWNYPEFGLSLVYAKSKEQVRTFIKDKGNFELKGNLRGVASGEEGYENGYIEIIGLNSTVKFYRNIKKIGIAPKGAFEGMVDLIENHTDDEDK